MGKVQNDWVFPMMRASGRIKVQEDGVVLHEVWRHDAPTGKWKPSGSKVEDGRTQIKFRTNTDPVLDVAVYRSRLVYWWFRGDIPTGMEVDHIDENASNDALLNLRLLSRTDNQKRANANRLARHGY